ncbi:unnamed protein product [Thelazia callipaeda]|uniref:Basigin n=1 Tax=Thelazia callipaeda TaxID=103827 RepID=A0A0N5CWV3_THECL|nr:unnamed protein product [Thelazia callipaeda]
MPTAQQLQHRKTNENIAVICSVVGLPKSQENDVDIKWYRENEPEAIVQLQRIAVSRVKQLSTRLLFIKPRVEDSGTYRCESKKYVLEAAEFLDIDLEQHPEDGSRAEIVCRVRGDPSLEIFWQFEGKNILEGILFVSFSGGSRNYEFRDEHQILVIPKYDSAHDDGQYACSAAQFYSFETVVINVTGYARPMITILDGSETNQGVEGRDFFIRCQATGKPEPHYQWIKYVDGDEQIITSSEKYVIDNGILTIRDLIPADRGTYSCIARNALDETRRDFNLTVFRKPKLKLLKNLTHTRGDTVDLVCEFSGDGNMKAQWLHLGEQWSTKRANGSISSHRSNSLADNGFDEKSLINSESDHVIVREGVGVVMLTLSKIDEDDAGQYQCVVENEAGMDQSSIFLSIIHAARVVDHGGTKRVVRGNMVEIHCGASAVPEPTWTWTGPNGVIYADGSKYILNSTALTSTLFVRDIEKKDFGKYTCSVDNGIGLPDHADLQIIEIEPPTVPDDLNCHEQNYPNFGICTIGNLMNSPPEKLPTNVTLYVMAEDKAFPDKWQTDSVNLTFEFAEDHRFKLYHLEPRTRYKIQAQTSNEAGVSGLSIPDIIETTDPWAEFIAPDAPNDVRYDCLGICKIFWSEPNDWGSPIIAYKLILKEIAHTEPRQYGSESYELDLGVDHLTANLPFLKPLTTYEIKLIAVNDIGNSNAYISSLTTSEYTVGGEHKGSSFDWLRLLFAIFLLLTMIIVIIDIICCVRHRRGLLATFASKFIGSPDDRNEKSKNALQNTKTETNRLLTEKQNEPKTVVR